MKYFFCVFIGILFFSCIDPFKINLEEGEELLVISGTFTPENRPHQLELYYTKNQIERSRRPLEGAIIQILTEDGEIELYSELGDGQYQLLGNSVKGQVGKSYFLEIETPNGSLYRSIPEIMPLKIRGDSAYIRFNFLDEILSTGAISKKSFLEIFVDSSLPENIKDYWLKWEVSTLYSFPQVFCGPTIPSIVCFIPGQSPSEEVILLNGESFENKRIEQLKLSEKRLNPSNFEFRGRHYFLVNQQSISQGAHDYWQKVNKVANQTGSIFDAPPAGIPGNFYNVNDKEEVVLGYFELQNIDSLRTFITEGQLSQFYDFTTIVCPSTFRPFSEFFFECCNCLSIENASLNRPSWF